MCEAEYDDGWKSVFVCLDACKECTCFMKF